MLQHHLWGITQPKLHWKLDEDDNNHNDEDGRREGEEISYCTPILGISEKQKMSCFKNIYTLNMTFSYTPFFLSLFLIKSRRKSSRKTSTTKIAKKIQKIFRKKFNLLKNYRKNLESFKKKWKFCKISLDL